LGCGLKAGGGFLLPASKAVSGICDLICSLTGHSRDSEQAVVEIGHWIRYYDLASCVSGAGCGEDITTRCMTRPALFL
jgi:hypothetical protein